MKEAGPNTPWRIFCAVELPPEVKARAAERVARLREAFPHVRASWERPEKMHVTLKFLGGVGQSRVQDVTRAAARAVGSLQPFGLALEGAGSFPPRGAARVLWLGVSDPSGGLARLHEALEGECAADNFPREGRRYHPHLTLARLRSPADAGPLAALHRETPFEPAPFRAAELLVVRSELGPAGSRYTTVSSHNF